MKINSILNSILLTTVIMVLAIIGNSNKISAQEAQNSKDIVILSGVEKGSYHAIAKDIKKLIDRDIKKLERKIEDYEDDIEDIEDQLDDNPSDTAKITKLEKKILKREKEKKKLNRLSVTILSSKGSDDNFQRLVKRTEIDLAFLQYDVLLMHQLIDIEMNTYFADDLRLFMPLGDEHIHLITGVNSGIKTLRDLKGKRVATGNPKSGTAVTCEVIKAKTGLTWTDVPLPYAIAFTSVVNEKIDAMFFIGAAPVSKFELPVAAKDRIRLIPVYDNELSKENTYSPSVIKKGTYKWAEYDINTYAVKSIIAVNISNEKKHELLLDLHEYICKNLDILREKGHKTWKEVDFDYKSVDLDLYEGTEVIFEEYMDMTKDEDEDEDEDDKE